MQYATVRPKSQAAVDAVMELIRDFKEKEPEIQGQMVLVFPAGVPIASTWEGSMDPILIGAVTAAVKMTFQHLCDHLKKGRLERVFVGSENGKVIIQNAGEKAVLVTVIPFEADLYRIAFVASNMAKKIEKLMEGY